MTSIVDVLVKRGSLIIKGDEVNETHDNVTRQEAYAIVDQWTEYDDALTYDEFDDGSVGIFTDTDVEALWTPRN